MMFQFSPFRLSPKIMDIPDACVCDSKSLTTLTAR